MLYIFYMCEIRPSLGPLYSDHLTTEFLREISFTHVDPHTLLGKVILSFATSGKVPHHKHWSDCNLPVHLEYM